MSALQSGGWNVGRATGKCAGCGVELLPGAVCWAALCDGVLVLRTEGEKKEEAVRAPFMRVDYCEACWAAGKRPVMAGGGGEMFSYWKTAVPEAQQKKKLLVDDSVLVDVFARMEGKTEAAEVRFRFVLALILMRKRLLKYEGMVEQAGGEAEGTLKPEVWRMIPRGAAGEEPREEVHVVNPHLTAEQIAEVSQQLSAILAEEV